MNGELSLMCADGGCRRNTPDVAASAVGADASAVVAIAVTLASLRGEIT